jgi:mono/diheme cytochrome c family protein
MTKNILRFIAPAAVVVLVGCADKEAAVSFKTDVKPVLEHYCAECHMPGGEGTAASGFVVDSYSSVMAGGKLGPMVVPGDALSSNLYRLVAGKVHPSIAMPHGKDKLPTEDVEKIKAWIDQGAQDN